MILNKGEQILPVITLADRLANNILTKFIKCVPRPIHCQTDQRYGHSKLSKAFSVSTEITAEEILESEEELRRQRKLSEESLFFF